MYRADLLVMAPKVTQAVFAALGDYYTWKLGECVYGAGSNEAWAAVCDGHNFSCGKIRALADCNGLGSYSLLSQSAVPGSGFVPRARFPIASKLP